MGKFTVLTLIFFSSFSVSVLFFKMRQTPFTQVVKESLVSSDQYHREPIKKPFEGVVKGTISSSLQDPVPCEEINSKSIRVLNSKIKLLDGEGKTALCITPEEIVLHWSEGVGANSVTYTTLRQRDLSCHFAIDNYETWQLLEMYEDVVELGYCTGVWEHNLKAINLELTGLDFDNFPPPESEMEQVLDLTCFLLKQYNIPKDNILGHFEILPEKKDPGEKFLNDFKTRLLEECP